MSVTSYHQRSPDCLLFGMKECAEGIIEGVRLGRLFYWRKAFIPARMYGFPLRRLIDCTSLSSVVIPGMLLWLPLIAPVWADDCDIQRVDDTLRVNEVIDGDTVRLTKREYLRFMSINTPEIDHKRHTAEPMAEKAREALKQLIGPSMQIKVQYGHHQRYDRHGRLLAHVFTDKGVNIQQRLLKQGLGFWIAEPPNLALMTCYHNAERSARTAHRGVWALNYYRPQTMAQLSNNERGFRFITGEIARVGETHSSIWLNLHDPGTPVKSKTRVALRISRDDLHYFKDTQFKQWQGRQVTARGWIYPYQGQLVMRIKHPAALEWSQSSAANTGNELPAAHGHRQATQ